MISTQLILWSIFLYHPDPGPALGEDSNFSRENGIFRGTRIFFQLSLYDDSKYVARERNHMSILELTGTISDKFHAEIQWNIDQSAPILLDSGINPSVK